MVETKHKYFIRAAPITPCQNSSWIMCLRIYGEGITQNPLSSPATIGPWPNIHDRQGLYYYLYWIACNTNINHLMVSFTNHCDISIDRLPSKIKIGKNSYFNNSLLRKPEVSSATNTFLLLLRNTHKKNKYSFS